LGLLQGKHAGGQSQLWIVWTEDMRHRLSGQAVPDPRLVSVRMLCRTQGKSPEEILRWAQVEGHAIYRLRRGTAMRFFILPRADEHDLAVAAAPVPGVGRGRDHDTESRPGELGAAAARLLAMLTPEPQTVSMICQALGLSKQELEQVVKEEYEALLRAGLQARVATKSEVPRAIRLPSGLNAEEYTYYSKLARRMGDDPNGGMM